jgi:hypothetical protein
MPTPLTFTPANYLMPQTVTLTGNDDILPGQNSPYSVHFSLASADSHYNGIKIPDLHAVNLEDGQDAGIILTPLTGFVNDRFLLAETGETGTFSLALATVPTDSVTVTLTFASNLPMDQFATVSPTTLTFPPDSTALNPQVVTIRGLPMSKSDLNHGFLQIDVTSNDSNYNTSSHPQLVVLNSGAPARAVLLSNQVLVALKLLNLDVKVHSLDVFDTSLSQTHYFVQVTVANVNSFTIPQLQVTHGVVGRLPDKVTGVTTPSQSSYSITSNPDLVVNIFNLPPQGTVSIFFEFPAPSAGDAPAAKNSFSVSTYANGGQKIRDFSGTSTTAVVSGAVEWLFLAGLGLVAGGRALERYLRRRRKQRAEGPDSVDEQSS